MAAGMVEDGVGAVVDGALVGDPDGVGAAVGAPVRKGSSLCPKSRPSGSAGVSQHPTNVRGSRANDFLTNDLPTRDLYNGLGAAAGGTVGGVFGAVFFNAFSISASNPPPGAGVFAGACSSVISVSSDSKFSSPASRSVAGSSG